MILPEQQLLYQAQIASQSKNYHLAEKLAIKILQQNASSTEAFSILAYVRLGQDRLAEAKTLCYKSLEIQPNQSDVFHQLSWIEYAQKEYARAFEAITKALEIDPYYAGYYAMLAHIQLFGFTNLTEAKNAFLSGLEIDSKNIECLTIMARWHLVQDQLPEAQEIIEKALKQDPSSPDLLHALSDILYAKGLTGDGRTAIIQALREAPEFQHYQIKLKSRLLGASFFYELVAGFYNSSPGKYFLKFLALLIGVVFLVEFYALLFFSFTITRWCVFFYYMFYFLLLFLPVAKSINTLLLVIHKHGRHLMSRSNIYSALCHLFLWLSSILSVIISVVSSTPREIELASGIGLLLIILSDVCFQWFNDTEEHFYHRYTRLNIVTVLALILSLIICSIKPIFAFEISSIAFVMYLFGYSNMKRKWKFETQYDLSKTISAVHDKY